MIDELTLKFDRPVSKTIVLDVIKNALAMYEFFNGNTLNEIEYEDLMIVQESIFECMFDDPTYHMSQILNETLSLEEPVYKNEEEIDDQDFMNWLIENGHVQFNDQEGTVTLPPPSEEFIKGREDYRKKYENTQELVYQYINQNFDEEQRHWMRIKS